MGTVFTAERIRTLRLSRGLSQERFSSLLNVSPRTVQGWEQGLRRPSRLAARLLLAVENAEIVAIQTSNTRRSGPSPTKPDDDRSLWEIIASLGEGIPAEEREIVPRDGSKQTDRYVYGISTLSE